MNDRSSSRIADTVPRIFIAYIVELNKQTGTWDKFFLYSKTVPKEPGEDEEERAA